MNSDGREQSSGYRGRVLSEARADSPSPGLDSAPKCHTSLLTQEILAFSFNLRANAPERRKAIPGVAPGNMIFNHTNWINMGLYSTMPEIIFP